MKVRRYRKYDWNDACCISGSLDAEKSGVFFTGNTYHDLFSDEYRKCPGGVYCAPDNKSTHKLRSYCTSGVFTIWTNDERNRCNASNF